MLTVKHALYKAIAAQANTSFSLTKPTTATGSTYDTAINAGATTGILTVLRRIKNIKYFRKYNNTAAYPDLSVGDLTVVADCFVYANQFVTDCAIAKKNDSEIRRKTVSVTIPSATLSASSTEASVKTAIEAVIDFLVALGVTA